jgi:MASE1
LPRSGATRKIAPSRSIGTRVLRDPGRSEVSLKAISLSAASPLRQDLSKVAFRTSARLAIVAGVAIAYFIFGKLGLRFATIHPSSSAIWAPSGISLAACLLFGCWIWPAICAGAFLVNATTYGSIATSVGIAIGNTAEALTGAYMVRRFARGQDAFNRTADTFRFVLLAWGDGRGDQSLTRRATPLDQTHSLLSLLRPN